MYKKALLVLCVLGCAAASFAADKLPDSKVYAYYFHGTMRCPTCHKLEQYSKEAVDTNFKNEIASGKLDFSSINTDERRNEHFIDDYRLYTKSLVLSLVKGGKEVKSKNLNKIWEFVGDKDRFLGYVKEEVADFLKES